MQSIHLIAGRYRDKVRQENVDQVVIAVPPPAVIDNRPFRRSQRNGEAVNV
jgi:hypothetical protein